MDFKLGEYVKRDRNKHLNIDSLPRKKTADPSSWKCNTRYLDKKLSPQSINCTHRLPYHKSKMKKNAANYECLDYLDTVKEHIKSMDKYTDGDTQSFFEDVYGKPYNQLTRQNQLHFLSQHVHWVKPVKPDRVQNMNDLDDGTNHKTTRYTLYGPNGYGTYTVCLSFLCHVLSVGKRQIDNHRKMILMSRKRAELVPVWSTNKNLESKLDDDSDSDLDHENNDWKERFNRFVCANYNLVRAHYVNKPNR